MNYDASSRLTTSISGTSVTTYTFDSNGNLTNVRPATGNRTTMAYDKENRLVDWKQGAATNATTYKYNGFGQKVNETNATGFNAYALIWDGDDYLGDVVDGADGPVFANLLRTVDGVMLGHVQDFMVDFLGSITGTTNVTTGAIVNTYRTKPYGAKLSGGTIGLGFFWTGITGSRSGFGRNKTATDHAKRRTTVGVTFEPLRPTSSCEPRSKRRCEGFSLYNGSLKASNRSQSGTHCRGNGRYDQVNSVPMP